MNSSIHHNQQSDYYYNHQSSKPQNQHRSSSSLLSPWEQFSLLYLTLVFVSLKLNVIWKLGRFFSLLNGVLCPENLLRCPGAMSSVASFWRDWHRSLNVWLVQYVYIPSGGKKRLWLSIPLTFLFMALWHEVASPRRLMEWGAVMAAVMGVEMVVQKEAMKRWPEMFHEESLSHLLQLPPTTIATFLPSTASTSYSSLSTLANGTTTNMKEQLLQHHHRQQLRQYWLFRLRILACTAVTFSVFLGNYIGFSRAGGSAVTFYDQLVALLFSSNDDDHYNSNPSSNPTSSAFRVPVVVIVFVFLYCGTAVGLVVRCTGVVRERQEVVGAALMNQAAATTNNHGRFSLI